MRGFANISQARISIQMSGDAMFSLAGKTAIITGGGSGLGQAIALALSGAGAKIVLVGRRESRLKETLENRPGAVIAVDLMKPDSLDSIEQFCVNSDLLPDIVVNAAGLNPRKSADEISLETWQSTLHLNLSVPFFLAQKLVPHMKAKGWGRIINIASLQSARAFPDGIAYGASKGGIVQLTRAMAEAWSSEGINANAIAPGFFPTELTAAVFADPERRAANAAATAIERNGNMGDVAGPAVFLASDASRYVTGQTLYVDGGYTAK
jgi:NAD(P)-dependent dehydrogenase (short-subunit alcohol dehydrogenase family)